MWCGVLGRSCCSSLLTPFPRAIIATTTLEASNPSPQRFVSEVEDQSNEEEGRVEVLEVDRGHAKGSCRPCRGTRIMVALFMGQGR